MYVTEYTGMRVRKLIAPATEAVIMSSPTCDSTWHRVVVSIDGAGSGQMYTDGTQVASVVGSASGFGYFVNTANEQNVQLRIGGGGAGGAPSLVGGLISDVRVYNRSLTAAEALALSRPPLPLPANAVIVPDPSTAPVGTSSFSYACAPGYGVTTSPPQTWTRSAADGSWSTSGVPVSCSMCTASQFTINGGTSPCITIPTLPPIAGAVYSPAVAAAGVTSYLVTCIQPGYAGLTQNYTWDASANMFQFKTWSDALGALVVGPTTTCTACAAATQFSYATVPAGFSCMACGSVDANLVVSSSLVGFVGSQQCGCVNNTFSNAWAGVETGLRCYACPTGSTASGSAATCTCKAGWTSFGTAASLACVCETGHTVVGTGSAADCILMSTTPSTTPTPSITPSSSTTASVSATPSTTSTSSLTATPSTTSTPSATPTASITASASNTASNTPTPSQTPSPSTVPDVLLTFACTIVPKGTSITPSNILLQYPTVLTSARFTFAALLGVAPSDVSVLNVTDIATGQSLPGPSIRPGSRRLPGSAGSQGVSLVMAVDFGKTPTQAEVSTVATTLSSLPPGALANLSSALAAATGLGASYFSVGVPASSVTTVNAPFAIGGGPSAASSSGSGGGSSAGGIVGGIIAALALACAIWGARSYRKHGDCPCCRDRKRSLVYRQGKDQAEENEEVSRAIADAEAGLGGGAALPSATPSSPGKGKAAKALVVRKLAEKASRADAEIAALRAELAAAKKDDDRGDEVAALRRQLAAAKLAAAKEASVPAAGPTYNPVVVAERFSAPPQGTS